jgi:hypothetical protein
VAYQHQFALRSTVLPSRITPALGALNPQAVYRRAQPLKLCRSIVTGNIGLMARESLTKHSLKIGLVNVIVVGPA